MRSAIYSTVVATSICLVLAIPSQAANDIVREKVIDAIKFAGENTRTVVESIFSRSIIFSSSALPKSGRSMQLVSVMPIPNHWSDREDGRGLAAQKLIDLPLADLRSGKAAVPPVFLGRFPGKTSSGCGCYTTQRGFYKNSSTSYSSGKC